MAPFGQTSEQWVHSGLLPLGRRMRIFLSLAQTYKGHTSGEPESEDSEITSTHKRCGSVLAITRSRRYALHPILLRHQTRRKYVQRCQELLQFTHTQRRSIQPDRINAERLHLPDRRGALLGNMFTYQQRILCQDARTAQRTAKDRHSPPDALWLQCLQPAAQKNAPARPVNTGRTISIASLSRKRQGRMKRTELYPKNRTIW